MTNKILVVVVCIAVIAIGFFTYLQNRPKSLSFDDQKELHATELAKKGDETSVRELVAMTKAAAPNSNLRENLEEIIKLIDNPKAVDPLAECAMREASTDLALHRVCRNAIASITSTSMRGFGKLLAITAQGSPNYVEPLLFVISHTTNPLVVAAMKDCIYSRNANEKLVIACVEALGSIKNPESIVILKQYSKDAFTPLLREMAKVALEQIQRERK